MGHNWLDSLPTTTPYSQLVCVCFRVRSALRSAAPPPARLSLRTLASWLVWTAPRLNPPQPATSPRPAPAPLHPRHLHPRRHPPRQDQTAPPLILPRSLSLRQQLHPCPRRRPRPRRRQPQPRRQRRRLQAACVSVCACACEGAATRAPVGLRAPVVGRGPTPALKLNRHPVTCVTSTASEERSGR